MALPVIKYKPQGADLNSLPKSFSGNVPFGNVNAPKVGYNAPGAVPKPAPKPRPPVGGWGEPTDPRYVGPPQPNPVPDVTPAPTNGLRVSYNPSAPTNPPAGQVPMGQNPAGDYANPRGNNDPYGNTGPFIPVPNPGGIVSNPMTGTPAQGPLPPIPEPTQPPEPNVRQDETLAERLARLQGLPPEQQGANYKGRLIGLQNRIDRLGGDWNPTATGQGKRENPPGNDMKLGDLAELAPPIGYATFFKDVGKSAALQARKEKIKANAGVTDTKKKKKAAAETTAAETPTKQAEGAGKNKGKLTDKQKKRLKRRPQPGTPERPYINRGVTYTPAGFGGSLRV